jgi:glycosyltransferase involved in cell wall biosynthesis
MTGPRTLHVVSSLMLDSGGPTQSVGQLCAALAVLGAPAEIATVQADRETLPLDLLTPLHTFPIATPRRLRRSPGLARFLLEEARRFDLIHVHGLWEWPGCYARRAAEASRKPLVISPRGMLEPWSLRQNRLTKHLALALWERRNLDSAALLHATAEMEAQNFRILGLHNPVAVIPNGLDSPCPLPGPRASTQRVLFLSRLHPKKGADLLLRAWARLGSKRSGWNLMIAGPDENGYQAALVAEAGRLGLGDTVKFLGPVYGDAKWDLIRGADLFVLPSHSENFGNVVVEALSQGVPVITTHGTPWRDLAEKGCGWWVPTSETALEGALAEALALRPSGLSAMGGKGEAWSRSTFSARAVAATMLRHYQDLLDIRSHDIADPASSA